MKKKALFSLGALLLLVPVGIWMSINLSAKERYNKLRKELSHAALNVTFMTDQTSSIYEDAKKHWTLVEPYEDVPVSAHTIALESIDMAPNVLNLVTLFSFRLPEYSFLKPKENALSMAMGALQATLLPAAMDGKIHVTKDYLLALIRHSPTLILVYRKTEKGLIKEMFYHKKQDSEKEKSPIQGSTP